MPIGATELIVVLLIVLFVFGAGRLPEVGSALGKGVRELRDSLGSEPADPPADGPPDKSPG